METEFGGMSGNDDISASFYFLQVEGFGVRPPEVVQTVAKALPVASFSRSVGKFYGAPSSAIESHLKCDQQRWLAGWLAG